MTDDLDTTRPVTFEPDGSASCSHVDTLRAVRPSAAGCEDCLRVGDRWVHLRICMECGHVGCCDDSPNRHASSHHRETGHPIIRSVEPGERWGWCFPDAAVLVAAPGGSRSTG